MKEGMVEWRSLSRGFLKIGGSTPPGVYLLPKILGVFKREFPGIEMDLLIGNTAQVEHWVMENTLSLGVIGKKPTIPDLEAAPFVKDELVVIAPPAVFAGLGISIVSPLCIQSERKHKDLHALRVTDAGFMRQFNIISLRGKHLSPGTQRFFDQLKAVSQAYEQRMR